MVHISISCQVKQDHPGKFRAQNCTHPEQSSLLNTRAQPAPRLPNKFKQRFWSTFKFSMFSGQRNTVELSWTFNNKNSSWKGQGRANASDKLWASKLLRVFIGTCKDEAFICVHMRSSFRHSSVGGRRWPAKLLSDSCIFICDMSPVEPDEPDSVQGFIRLPRQRRSNDWIEWHLKESTESTPLFLSLLSKSLLMNL